MYVINIFIAGDEISGALPLPRDLVLEIDRSEAMEGREKNELDLAMLSCSPYAKDLQDIEVVEGWTGNKLLKMALARLLVAHDDAYIALQAGHDFFVFIAEATRDENGEPDDLQWDFLMSYDLGDVDRDVGMKYVYGSFVEKRDYLATAIAAGLYRDDGHVAERLASVISVIDERESGLDEAPELDEDRVSIVFETEQGRRMIQLPRHFILEMKSEDLSEDRQHAERNFAALACTQNWADLEDTIVLDGQPGRVVLAWSLMSFLSMQKSALEAVRKGDDFFAIVAEATFNEEDGEPTLEWDVLGSRKVGEISEEADVTRNFSRLIGWAYDDLKAALEVGRYRKDGVVGALISE
ncbi:hypothetical protein AYJ57_20745 (plasmid) [Salipiger sp. CCB-MM3]|uniref:hypothetical protein n=1 Tax=Salipiger sp. CCB-MM3 TaxID=1792508 RepID=UPI00080AB5AB|nr:hypothetical protein [Salipiger sp. CCB-MM3]ANT62911.1 hypothetical protein AYJ57_20745 [Salipiger sp. CCB-MM3]